ncbi:MAG: L-proline glycine betaine binding transporter protein ProX, partial [Labilithrix sp.]|nr:L-proline glycine betaine binding transporter protein ProX [Labilithrix sp.]
MNVRARWWLALAVLGAVLAMSASAEAATLRVGSKRFTESYILAEIVVAVARSEGIDAIHERGLGGTAVTYRALADGAIDVYPEYSGTISETVVKDTSADLERLRAALAPRGLGISAPLGFQNTYALAVPRSVAARDALVRTSDLAGHASLRFGLSHEFVGRADGWPGLAARYGLDSRAPTAIDHALAYEALQKGSIDVTDVYTTDAKIGRYGLVVLEDDRHFFPPYEAVLFHRSDAMARFPAFARVLERLRGAIDTRTMQELNARAELDGAPFDQVAAGFLNGVTGAHTVRRDSFWSGIGQSIRRHGPRHLELVFGALGLSTLLGVPLGVVAYSRRRLGAIVLGITGVVQTIPSLALFCFFIPLLGIGPVPALAALFLYGLLPIVRNTHAGLASIPADLRDAAQALGLSPSERLRHVELPLASRTILAGVKTSAVVAVGSATIAAFIGAGGFGEPISTGLSLNDVSTILYGAIPAA